MKIRLSTYWRCQVTFWFVTVLMGTFFYFLVPAFSTINFYPALLLQATAGVFVLHAMRFVVLRLKLLQFNLLKKILSLIPLIILFSFGYSVISLLVNEIFHWNSQSFDTYSFEDKIFMATFSNIFFFSVWNLVYFIYHYIQENRRQLTDKIRLENKLKVRQLETEMNQLLQLQRVRAQIASDLHDDIGSTLNSISVYSEVAGQRLQTENENVKSILQKMGDASRNMIDRMNDIVWAINPKNDDFENILKRMQYFAAELLPGKNILLQFEAEDKMSSLKLPMDKRKNFYLIYKEAVNNAYKYSCCQNLNVSISEQDGNIGLVIADNGKGFDPATYTMGGNGLKNMKERADEIGAHLEITSWPGKGTRVCLKMKV